MHKEFSATTSASPTDLFAVVGNLETYPTWLDVVDSVERTEDGNAWIVTLRARVGPFARSKRLRMIRTVLTEPPTAERPASVRFERAETDGKEHSTWTLAADVAEVADAAGGSEASEVRLDLHYDGAMWTGLLDGVLNAAADRATDKLREYVDNTHNRSGSDR
ncbi:MAG: SRPBCC family protein [Actinomycetota bacterium]